MGNFKNLFKKLDMYKAKDLAEKYREEIIAKYESQNLEEKILEEIEKVASKGEFHYTTNLGIKDPKEKKIVAKHIMHAFKEYGSFKVGLTTETEVNISWDPGH